MPGLRVEAVPTTTGAVPVTTFNAADLGRESETWCVAQDADGLLYVGGNRLYVTDGERWREYPMGNSYAVRDLKFSADGRLWAAGNNELGWFEQSLNNDWTYHSLRNHLPDSDESLGDIWNVYPTEHGEVVFVGDRSILHWNGANLKIWAHEVPRRLISAQYRGDVYVYYRNQGLLRVNAEGPSLFLSKEKIGPYGVYWIGDLKDRLAFVTTGGAGFVDAGKLTHDDPKLSTFIRENILTSVRQLPDGTLALGTLRGGIALVGSDLKLQRVLNTAGGLPTDEIFGLFVDRDGALWATSSTRFFRLNTMAGIVRFDARHGLPSSGVTKLTEFDQTLTVLTDEGVAQLQPDADTPHKFTPLGELRGGYRDVATTPDGLLVSTTFGVHTLTDGQTHPVYRTSNDVFKIHPADRPGWYDIADGRKIVRFSIASGAARELTHELPDIAEDFLFDDNGRLWIGTGAKGLLVAQPRANTPVVATNAASTHGFPNAEGRVQITRFESTLVAFGADGAHWLNPATDRFEPVQEFPAGHVLAISNADNTGRVWVALAGARAGLPPRIGRLVTAENGVAWQPRAIEGLATAGLPRDLLVQAASAGEVLWIAGSEALLRVEQPGRLVPPTPRKPLLRAVALDADELSPRPAGGRLPYTIRRLHLEFGSTDYGRRETLRYQTRLIGLDRDWSAPTNDAELNFTNLREGDYTFEVRIIADTGEVSEPAVLRFAIAPPWWRTPYAYGGYAVLLAAALAGIYGLRLRTVRRRAHLLEETVRQRTHELEKANAAKTEFVASMSHEIRNPMNGIIGSATALAATPLNAEQSELVATLRNCATFLASLVEDVLDFSAIEAGAFTVQTQPCIPAEILESVTRMLANPAAEAGAHFDIEIDPTLPSRVLADPARVQQIVVNYATNALKFSGGGRVRLSAYSDNGHVTFAVTDDGPGISTEDQAVLFTRFSRLKTARQAGLPGAGLGLAVCRAVAERMQGSVGVASAPGRGATFFLRLPLRAASDEVHNPLPALPSMAGARALVVEDLDYNARALGAMLQRYGFTVDFARCGEEALRLLAAGSYRAVFLDYDLPDMSGLEVARRLRAREAGLTHTMVIATTAYSTVQDREACLAAGMDSFLGKPITPEKLHAALTGIPAAARPAASVQLPAETDSSVNLRLLAFLAGDAPGALSGEIGRYLEVLQTLHLEFIDALVTRDRPVLGRAAHRLVSHARMVDAEELAATARAIEDAADFAEETELERMGGQLASAIFVLKKSLTRHLPAKSSA